MSATSASSTFVASSSEGYERLMGRWVNGRAFNILAWIIVAVLILLTLVLILVTVFPGFLGG